MRNYKKLIILLLPFFAISCKDIPEFKIDCLPSNLKDGVIAFYPFNGGSIEDGSANSNDLTNSTLAKSTSDRNGNLNCAFLFDNSQTTEEYLSTSNSNFLNGLNDISISLWYLPLDSSRAGDQFEVLLGRGDDGRRCPDRSGEWSIGLFDCRRAVFGHNNSVWAKTLTGFSNGCQGEVYAVTGSWHHVVAVKKGDTYQLYFNGNLDDTTVGAADCSEMYAAQDLGDLFIGKYFTGKIDDVIIYDRALSKSEVSELYNLDACCE